MSRSQRSKTGCWTCRLRRKKCNEGGLPCLNCESRGVFCHGYGPKPPWKDRGEKEKEQAIMLRIQPRQRRSSSKNLSGGIPPQCPARSASVSNSDYNPDITVPAMHSPSQSDLSSSCLTSSQECQTFELLDDLDIFGSLDAPSSSTNDIWLTSSSAEALADFNDIQPPAGSLRSNHPEVAISTSTDSWLGPSPAEAPNMSAEFQPPIDDRQLDSSESSNDLQPSLSSADTLNSFAHLQPPSSRDPQPRLAIGLPTATAGQSFGVDEREIELVMQYIGETFALQHTSYRAASTIQRSWVLLLLMRSPTFYYASLSMSAYHDYLSLSGDHEARISAFQTYQKYRNCALTGFHELLKSDHLPVSSSSPLPGECMICGVQIALLEVRYQTYSSSAVFVAHFVVTSVRPWARTCNKVGHIWIRLHKPSSAMKTSCLHIAYHQRGFEHLRYPLLSSSSRRPHYLQ